MRAAGGKGELVAVGVERDRERGRLDVRARALEPADVVAPFRELHERAVRREDFDHVADAPVDRHLVRLRLVNERHDPPAERVHQAAIAAIGVEEAYGPIGSRAHEARAVVTPRHFGHAAGMPLDDRPRPARSIEQPELAVGRAHEERAVARGHGDRREVGADVDLRDRLLLRQVPDTHLPIEADRDEGVRIDERHATYLTAVRDELPPNRALGGVENDDSAVHHRGCDEARISAGSDRRVPRDADDVLDSRRRGAEDETRGAGGTSGRGRCGRRGKVRNEAARRG